MLPLYLGIVLAVGASIQAQKQMECLDIFGQNTCPVGYQCHMGQCEPDFGERWCSRFVEIEWTQNPWLENGYKTRVLRRWRHCSSQVVHPNFFRPGATVDGIYFQMMPCGPNHECIEGSCVPLPDPGCQTNDECKLNEQCTFGICVPDESNEQLPRVAVCRFPHRRVIFVE